VIDNEICGMAQRLVAGIEKREEMMAEDLYADLAGGDYFLTSPVTLRWLRQEVTSPGRVISRETPEVWQKNGRKSAAQRAWERVQELLAINQPKPLPDDLRQHLMEIMKADALQYGMAHLPIPHPS
jgi:trimethylamine--corrinoid protein Co-methyltransferase